MRAPVRLLPPGHDPAETVRAEIERQLNAPFTRDGRIDPFRFFALDRGGSFDLGLAYDHFIAAGDSIVALLKAIAERYGSGASDVRRRGRAEPVPADVRPPVPAADAAVAHRPAPHTGQCRELPARVPSALPARQRRHHRIHAGWHRPSGARRAAAGGQGLGRHGQRPAARDAVADALAADRGAPSASRGATSSRSRRSSISAAIAAPAPAAHSVSS